MAEAAQKSQQRILVALRQLALLAPNGRMAAAEAMALLNELIRYDTYALLWLDEKHKPIDILSAFDSPCFTALDFVENFVSRTDSDAIDVLTDCYIQDVGARFVEISRQNGDGEFVRSRSYNTFAHRIGCGWGVMLSLCNGDGKPLANLTVWRSLHAAEFTEFEIGLLEQAHPWLEHLLRKDAKVGDAPDVRAFSSVEHATLLIDGGGKVRLASTGALGLLHQAAGVPVMGESLKQSVDGDITVLLQRISRGLPATCPGLPNLPSSLSINNHWGRFHLRSYNLSAFESAKAGKTALHIERQVPFWLRLFSAPRFLELSPREREACLHVLAGSSHTEIASKMGVKSSTAIYFIRKIYLRLGINRHVDLMSALTNVEL